MFTVLPEANKLERQTIDFWVALVGLIGQLQSVSSLQRLEALHAREKQRDDPDVLRTFLSF